MSSLVVYSALFGSTETLVEQDVAGRSDAEFHLFTDDPGLTSATWNVHLVEPRFRTDSIRSARSVKILGRPELARFDTTLWIDNRIELTRDPVPLVASWLERHDIALLRHSFRETVLDEFDAVARLGYDEPARVYEQLVHYGQLETNALEDRPFATGIMARRWTPQVKGAMEDWIAHVLRYSRRDQLSVGQALKDARLEPFVIDVDNLRSDFHRWWSREEVGRTESTGKLKAGDSGRPPILRLKDVSAELAEVRADAGAREAELLAEIARLEARLGEESPAAVSTARIARADERVAALLSQIEGLERLVLELARSSAEREAAAARIAESRGAARPGQGTPEP